jgi:3-oxoacyl-[acyl-carrier-protein] synthase-3
MMQFQKTCIESLGYCVPDETLSSTEIENQLSPLYERLRLPAGRLELMTGIVERRLWPVGMLPSKKSIESGNHAIEAAAFDRSEIGVLIHASVCRDHLEPATACRVHHELGLRKECMIYDVSNACLGLMNGVLQVANMIELGHVRAGLVLGTEDSRHLLETTIKTLNADKTLTRNTIKLAVASFTIGSASGAILICDETLSRTDNHLHAAGVRANTDHHRLCHSGRDEAVEGGMQPLMQTDSEALMQEGIATGVDTFQSFLAAAKWNAESINKTVCHQVGVAHRRLMLESLGIPIEKDFATMQWLGNTGSVALPTALAIGAEQDHLNSNDNVALLGIGSGINCLMLGLQWNKSLVRGSGSVPQSAGFTV